MHANESDCGASEGFAMSIAPGSGCAARSPEWWDAMVDVARKLVCGVIIPLWLVGIIANRSLALADVTGLGDAVLVLGWNLGPVGAFYLSLTYGIPTSGTSAVDTVTADSSALEQRTPHDREQARQQRKRRATDAA